MAGTECDHSRPDGGTLFVDVGEDAFRCSYCGAKKGERAGCTCPSEGPDALVSAERRYMEAVSRCPVHGESVRPSPARTPPLEVDCPTCNANREAACHTVGAVTRKMKSFHAERIAEARAMDDEMARRRKDDEEQSGKPSPPARPRYVLKTFKINDAKFWGYTDGSLWNGWAVPYFVFDVAVEITKRYHGRFDVERDGFITSEEGLDSDVGDEYFGGMTIRVDGKDIRVYPIGAWAWTWEVA